MQRGPLKKEDDTIIQTNYVYLKQNLEARDLTDFLFQSGVISTTDKERIDNGIDRSVRNEELLKTLLHAGSGPAFDCFLKSLEKQYSDVLKHLKRSAQKAVKLGHLKKQIEKLNKQVDDVEADRDETRKLLMGKCEENNELQARLAQKDVENGNLKKQIEKLNKQIEDIEADRDETREQLMDKCEENNELQSCLDVAQTKSFSQSELIDLPTKPEYEANRSDTELSRSRYEWTVAKRERLLLKSRLQTLLELQNTQFGLSKKGYKYLLEMKVALLLELEKSTSKLSKLQLRIVGLSKSNFRLDAKPDVEKNSRRY